MIPKNILTLLTLYIISISTGQCLLHNEAPAEDQTSYSYLADFDVFDTPEPKNCTTEGLLCLTCSKLVNCIELPDGSFLTEELYDCDDKTTCSESSANCTTEPNPDCPLDTKYTFKCSQVGNFPDPFTCNRYYICVPKESEITVVNPVPILATCSKGFAYNPLMGLCNIRIDTKGCKNPIPPCTIAGQSGALVTNPSFYYTCSKQGTDIFPNWHICQKNWVYTGKKCEDMSSPPIKDNICDEKKWFDDPTDCKSYYECPEKGKAPIKRSCGSNRFVYKSQKCLNFDCFGY